MCLQKGVDNIQKGVVGVYKKVSTIGMFTKGVDNRYVYKKVSTIGVFTKRCIGVFTKRCRQ